MVLVFSFWLIFSVTARAENYLIYISVEDGIAITRANREALSEIFASGLPDHRQMIISVNSLPDGIGSGKLPGIIAEKVAKAARALKPTDTITHLILDSHGETIGQGTEAKSRLVGLGEIYSDHLDSDLKSVLEPLRPFASKEMTVVLNACNTMCGSEDTATSRAKTFLDFMGATSGTFYGAVTTETDLVRTEPRFFKFRHLIPSKRAMAIFLAVSAAMAAIPMIENFEAIPFFLGTLRTFAWLLPSVEIGSRILVPWADKKGWINQGKFFRFQEGQLQTVEAVAKTRDLEKIFGLEQTIESCPLKMSSLY
jgi:hypothetical protein